MGLYYKSSTLLAFFVVLLAATTLFFGCVTTQPSCGNDFCEQYSSDMNELNPDSSYYCPSDCGEILAEKQEAQNNINEVSNVTINANEAGTTNATNAFVPSCTGTPVNSNCPAVIDNESADVEGTHNLTAFFSAEGANSYLNLGWTGTPTAGKWYLITLNPDVESACGDPIDGEVGEQEYADCTDELNCGEIEKYFPGTEKLVKTAKLDVSSIIANDCSYYQATINLCPEQSSDVSDCTTEKTFRVNILAKDNNENIVDQESSFEAFSNLTAGYTQTGSGSNLKSNFNLGWTDISNDGQWILVKMDPDVESECGSRLNSEEGELEYANCTDELVGCETIENYLPAGSAANKTASIDISKIIGGDCTYYNVTINSCPESGSDISECTTKKSFRVDITKRNNCAQAITCKAQNTQNACEAIKGCDWPNFYPINSTDIDTDLCYLKLTINENAPKFEVGQFVTLKTEAAIGLKSSPSLSGTKLAPSGAYGKIIRGPTKVDGNNWWLASFTYADGSTIGTYWAMTNELKNLQTSASPTITKFLVNDKVKEGKECPIYSNPETKTPLYITTLTATSTANCDTQNDKIIAFTGVPNETYSVRRAINGSEDWNYAGTRTADFEGKFVYTSQGECKAGALTYNYRAEPANIFSGYFGTITQSATYGGLTYWKVQFTKTDGQNFVLGWVHENCIDRIKADTFTITNAEQIYGDYSNFIHTQPDPQATITFVTNDSDNEQSEAYWMDSSTYSFFDEYNPTTGIHGGPIDNETGSSKQIVKNPVLFDGTSNISGININYNGTITNIPLDSTKLQCKRTCGKEKERLMGPREECCAGLELMPYNIKGETVCVKKPSKVLTESS